MLDYESKEQSRKSIAELIEKYKEILRRGHEDRYDEENVKIKFINPFLQLLGWDVEGLDEVKAEQRTLTGRVDFSLRLERGMRPRIFCEVKRFDLGRDGLDGFTVRGGKRMTYPEQAIGYAWQMHVDWAVLTNFKEIRLYSSHVRKASEGLVFSLSWDSYIEEFDKLWLLSKESVASGLLDAQERRRTRNTIHEEAPEDLFNIRSILAHDIHKHNMDIPPEKTQEAVQRILDRLIVCRAAEDRSIIRHESLWKLYSAWKETQIDDTALFVTNLRDFFRQFDSIYNSKLFEKHYCEDLVLSNQAMEKVLRTLYEFNFDLIDADILGNIYEEYLGHVLREGDTALERPRFEKNDIARKKGGIYYTPTYVVSYIVEHTLGVALQELSEEEIASIRILDPACGSGSFLIKAYDYLLQHYMDINRKQRATIRPPKSLIDVDEYPQPITDIEKTILMKNLFGVDVDPQAAELGSVSLMLKALRKGEKLPLILDENIKVGNSLVTGGREDLEPFFGDGWKDVKPFDWASEMPDQLSEGGFDIVIGNPPYVDIYTIPKEYREYFMSGIFESAYKKFDLYVLFLETGLKLLREGGLLGFIIPNALMTSPYGKKIRKMILDTCVIEEITDLTQVKVFPRQSVRNIILIVRKESNESTRNDHVARVVTVSPDTNLVEDGISGDEESLLQGLFLEMPEYQFRLVFKKPELLDIVKEMERNSVLLEEAYYINWGLRTGTKELTEKMIVRDPQLPLARKFIRGENILDRYLMEYGKDFIIYEPQELYNPMFPELFESPKLIIRKISGTRGLFATMDENGYYCFSTIIVALPYSSVESSSRARVPEGGVDKSKKMNLGYVLAVLNSSAMRFYYSVRISDRLSVVPNHVKRLPIPEAPLEIQEELDGLAREMTSLKNALHKELPLTEIDRHLSVMPRTLDTTFSSFYDRLPTSDKKSTFGTVAKDHISDLRIELEGNWLHFIVTSEETTNAKAKQGKVSCRFPQTIAHFLHLCLKRYEGSHGNNIVINLIRSFKIPHFDSDSKRNIGSIESLMDKLNQHITRSRELKETISELDLRIDDVVFGLYNLKDHMDEVREYLASQKKPA